MRQVARRWALACVMGLALPSWAVAQDRPAALRIQVEEQALLVEGATPGGSVVWFWVGREIREDFATLLRQDGVAEDTDKDGTVRVEVDRTIPPKAVAVAVDLASGAHAAAAPAGSPLRQGPFRGVGVLMGQGPADRVEELRDFCEVVVVRPGTGAWGYTAGDGGRADEDGAPDGRVAMALDRMRPLGASPEPPQRFHPRDVVALIDPNRLELVLVTAGPGQGGQP